MALVGEATTSEEAAKLLLPRANMIERAELAGELNVVAAFHYPGARGWHDLEASEKPLV
jgi:hypothetical protein